MIVSRHSSAAMPHGGRLLDRPSLGHESRRETIKAGSRHFRLFCFSVLGVPCSTCLQHHPFDRKGDPMTLDEVILELYRLAETKKWDGGSSDEALAAAIEGMEQIWTLRQADARRT